MKKSFIKTGAAVLCTALALTCFGNVSNVLAYQGEVPYEDFGIDPSELSDAYKFADYQDYAVVVVLPNELGPNPSPELRALAAEATNAVYNVRLTGKTLEQAKAEVAEIMDYYLARMDELKLADNSAPYEEEKAQLINYLTERLYRQYNTPAAKREIRKAITALRNLRYDNNLSLEQNRVIMYNAIRNVRDIIPASQI